jgi:hypothetical protein
MTILSLILAKFNRLLKVLVEKWQKAYHQNLIMPYLLKAKKSTFLDRKIFIILSDYYERDILSIINAISLSC